MFAVLFAAVLSQASPAPPPDRLDYANVYMCKALVEDARTALRDGGGRPPTAEAAARLAVLERLEDRVDEALPGALDRERWEDMPGWREENLTTVLTSVQYDLRLLMSLYSAEVRAEELEGCIARFEVADR